MIKYPTASQRDSELEALRAAMHRVRAIANWLQANDDDTRVSARYLAGELHTALDGDR